MAKSRLVNYRRKRSKKAPKTTNPPLGEDLKNLVGPAIGAYVVTNFVGRMAYTICRRKWPQSNACNYAQVVATGAVAGATIVGAHRIEALKDYHNGLVTGSSIAAAKCALQRFVPKYGWIVSDCKPEDVQVGNSAPAALPQPAGASLAAMSNFPEPDEEREEDIDLDNLDAEMGDLAEFYAGSFSD